MILRTFLSEKDYVSPNSGSGLILDIYNKYQDDISTVQLFITKSQKEGFFENIIDSIRKELSNSNKKLVIHELGFESIPKKADFAIKKSIIKIFSKEPDDDQEFYINCAENIGKIYWPLIHKELKVDFREIRKSGDSLKITGGDKWGNYIGKSEEIMDMKSKIERYAKYGRVKPILLIGDTGVGKTHLSKKIAGIMGRPAEKYNFINCGLYRNDTQGFSIRLFGGNYNRQKFTSLIDDVGDGVLELREIGNIDEGVQQVLNGLFDDMTYTCMPGGKTKKAKCLFVGTTNVHISQIKDDLEPRFYVIEIPSLSDRNEDVEPLIDWFINKKKSEFKGVPKINFESSCISHLRGLQWPKNIRQLEDFIEECYMDEDISDRDNILWDDVSKHYRENEESDVSLSRIVKQYPLKDKNLNDHLVEISLEYTRDAANKARKNSAGEPRPQDVARLLNLKNPDGKIRDDLARTKLDQLNRHNIN